MSHKKGDRWERNYRRALNARDDSDRADVDRVNVDLIDVVPYYCVRMPSSGSATTDDLPDLHVWADWRPWGGGRYQYAVESKAFANDGGATIEYGDAESLAGYASATWSVPILFVHVDYVGDFVVHIDDLHDTGSAYSIRAKRDVEDADPVTFADFVRNEGAVV